MQKHRSSTWWMSPLLALVLSACGVLSPSQKIQPAPASAPRFAAVPEDSVAVHAFSEPPPSAAVSVAQFTVPDSMESHADDELIAAYRPHVARMGATWITVDPSGGRRRIVAYHVPAWARVRRVADDSESRPSVAPSTSGGPVQVRGYRRRDGTYVRPHTRSRPRSRH